MNERKTPAVEVEAGNAVDDGLARDEHVNARRDDRTKRGERGGRQQDGCDAMAAVREETLDNEPTLRDEQAARLEPSRIANVAIRRQARVVFALDQSSLRCTDRRLRCPSMTCWPRRLLRKTFDSPLSTGCGTKRTTSNASCASVLRIS